MTGPERPGCFGDCLDGIPECQGCDIKDECRREDQARLERGG